jgi:hypothetical protein
MSGAFMMDRVPEAAAPRQLPWGVAGSMALHAGLVAALFLLTPLRDFIVPDPPAISVDLIPIRPAEPAPAPVVPPQLAAPAPAEKAEPGAPVLQSDGTFHATRLYTGQLLDTPAMATVRRGLTTFADSERVIQLCNIEALEQIRLAAPQYDPDTMVSYAMADPIQAGLMLTAMGGAFRSRRLWYNVSFQCVAAPALDGVTSFSFKLGEAIPESEWEAHYLNAEDKVE